MFLTELASVWERAVKVQVVIVDTRSSPLRSERHTVKFLCFDGKPLRTEFLFSSFFHFKFIL